MKIVRLLALTAVIALLAVATAPVAEADGCCIEFELICQGYCLDKGGVLMTNCNGVEHCICSEWPPYVTSGYCAGIE